MALLDLLFPPRCASCGRGSWPFCGGCHGNLVPLLPPWCSRCGMPAARDVARCARCPPEPIAWARAPFLFAGPARAAVHRLKFAGWRSVAGALGDAMATSVGDVGTDVLTWVPLSRRRRAARGYDQARALARRTAVRLGRPAVPLLRRVRDTRPQARREAADRREAMAGAFAVLPGVRVPPRVLLVDDVLTTGATAAACAEELLAAGARRVALLTAARSVPRVPGRRYTRVGSRPGLWLPGEPPR